MKKVQSELDLHVFVCTNQKQGKPCCANRNAEELRGKLKEWVKENPAWQKRVRINASGCLDHCKEGIAIVIYPNNEWLVDVGLENLDDVKSQITKLLEVKR